MSNMYCSGDFTVQVSHGSKSVVSVFQLLYNMATIMVGRSNKLQDEKTKTVKIAFNVIYRRILWSEYLYFCNCYVCYMNICSEFTDV